MDSGYAHISIFDEALVALARELWARDGLQRACMGIVDNAKNLAPKKTGEGARGIHTAMVEGVAGWEAHITWNEKNFYMLFQEVGTYKMRPHAFLRPALKLRTSASF
jgi:HK97 gp10 family phage protein